MGNSNILIHWTSKFWLFSTLSLGRCSQALSHHQCASEELLAKPLRPLSYQFPMVYIASALPFLALSIMAASSIFSSSILHWSEANMCGDDREGISFPSTTAQPVRGHSKLSTVITFDFLRCWDLIGFDSPQHCIACKGRMHVASALAKSF